MLLNKNDITCHGNFISFSFYDIFITASKGFWAEILGVGDFYYEVIFAHQFPVDPQYDM